MTLFYGKVRGHSPATSWETGFYFGRDALDPATAVTAFDAWCSNFFNAGTIHAYGYNKYQTSSQGADWIDVYTVDETTDRKALIQQKAFSSTGTSAVASQPPQNAPLVHLRPAVKGQHIEGRLYLPPFSGNAISTGQISSAAAAEFADFLTDAFGVLDSILTPVWIRNRKTHTKVQAVTFSVSQTVASVRRRITPLAPVLITRNI